MTSVESPQQRVVRLRRELAEAKQAANDKRGPGHEVLVRLGLRIRILRKKAGMTQETMEQASGLHRTYIGDVERGHRNTTVLSLHKIAGALGVELVDLFRRVN